MLHRVPAQHPMVDPDDTGGAELWADGWQFDNVSLRFDPVLAAEA